VRSALRRVAATTGVRGLADSPSDNSGGRRGAQRNDAAVAQRDANSVEIAHGFGLRGHEIRDVAVIPKLFADFTAQG
jgi:hypothetical protein